MADFEGADFEGFRTEATQDRAELIVEAMGHQGLAWEGEGFEPSGLLTTRAWLRAKANSIEGGTSGVNLNVVAKWVLGLSDPK